MRIVKPVGKKEWHIEVTTENGSKKLISTGCLTREGAKQVAEISKAKELELASKAHRLTSEVVSVITGNQTILIEDALSNWDQWMKTSSTSPRTRYNNIGTVKQWIEEMGLSGRTIASINEADIHRWINRQGDESKVGTRRMKLSAIRGLMKYCAIKRFILSDPSQLVRVDLRMATHEQRETQHKKVFTDDEIEFLISKSFTFKAKVFDKEVERAVEPPSISPGFIRAGIILGRDLGLRLSDICNLEWASFNMAKKTVTVWMGKTGNRIEIKASSRVMKLVTQLDKTDSRFLFPQEQEIISDPSRRAMLSSVFTRFFERNGFDDRTFHSIRATLATTLANQGATMEEIAAALGHGDQKVTQAYVRREGAAMTNKR